MVKRLKKLNKLKRLNKLKCSGGSGREVRVRRTGGRGGDRV
jgi:hypothetical protein